MTAEEFEATIAELSRPLADPLTMDLSYIMVQAANRAGS